MCNYLNNILSNSYSKIKVNKTNTNIFNKYFYANNKIKIFKSEIDNFNLKNFLIESGYIYYQVYRAKVNNDKVNLFKYLSYPLYLDYKNLDIKSNIYKNEFSNIRIINEDNLKFYQIDILFYYENDKLSVTYEKKDCLYNDLNWKIRYIDKVIN